MLNEIKNLKNNLTAENLDTTFSAYENMVANKPRIMRSIGKPNREAAEICDALDDLRAAMRKIANSEEIAYMRRFAEDQNEG